MELDTNRRLASKEPPMKIKLKVKKLPAKRSRVGRHGLVIICPYCYRMERAWHLRWTGIYCKGCKSIVWKEEYLVQDTKGR